MSDGPGEYVVEDPDFPPESPDTEVTLPSEQQESSTENEPSTSEETQQPSSQQPSSQQTAEEIKDNPAWNDILKGVPEQFHPHLKGHLSKSDARYQQLTERYTPYKEFADNNITPQQLVQGLQLIQAFNQNPKAVYEYLAQAYNFQAQQAQQSQAPTKQTEQESLELGENQPDIFNDPRFQQVANQAAAAQQLIENMQMQNLQSQMQAQVDAEYNAVSNHMQYKNIPMDMIIRQALGRASEQTARTGRETAADLMAAAKELWESGRFTPRNQNPPPNLSRSRTGTPAEGDPLEGIGSKSRQQRTAIFAALAQAANDNNG